LKNKIAWLVYRPEKKRNKENTFDSNYNIGALVVNNELIKAGYEIGYVTPESANEADIILISFTSTYDLIAYYKAVSKYKHWKNRKFKVIAGGFGLQNINSIKNYIDIAVFGRAEGQIIDIINGNYDYDNVMVLPEIKPIKIRQVDSLYSDEICLIKKNKVWKETFVGCPNRCKFCHYSWARKKVGTVTYLSERLVNKPQILWKDIKKINKYLSSLKAAMDGFSEKLRNFYGKKISNLEIIEGIEHIGSFTGTTMINVYNICNMPNETKDDFDEFKLVLDKCNPINKTIIVLQSSPFRPSPITPMQWEPVKLLPDWHKVSGTTFYSKNNLLAVHSLMNESCWSHLVTTIIERATEQSEKLINTICFSSKLNKYKAEQKVKMLEHHFDLSPYLREYDVEEKLPTWYLESYTPNEKIKKMAVKLKQNLGLAA